MNPPSASVPDTASEFALIKQYFTRPTRHSVLGGGDDAALLQARAGFELAISTDMLVAGTHFLSDVEPRHLGWKTLAVNVSDLAAMGAQPRWAVLALALPQTRALDSAWLASFAAGFFACAERYGIDVIGGDTTRGPLSFCVTILGEVPAGRALRRTGAQAGDEIWVSGQPGLAALGLAQRQGRTLLPQSIQASCLAALETPQPRVELGLALMEQRLAHAAIDVSDGLLADLDHILENSNLAARLFASQLPALPCNVDPALARSAQLAGGDDFELVFTAPAHNHAALQQLSQTLQLPLTCIGSTQAQLKSSAARLQLLDASGCDVTPAQLGYDHFHCPPSPAQTEQP